MYMGTGQFKKGEKKHSNPNPLVEKSIILFSIDVFPNKAWYMQYQLCCLAFVIRQAAKIREYRILVK